MAAPDDTHKERTPLGVCLTCSPGAVDIGRIGRWFVICRTGGQVQLVDIYRTHSRTLITFTTDPTANIADDLFRPQRRGEIDHFAPSRRATTEKLLTFSKSWYKSSKEQMEPLAASLHGDLYNSALLLTRLKKLGHRPRKDDAALHWLYNRIGRVVDAAKSATL